MSSKGYQTTSGKSGLSMSARQVFVLADTMKIQSNLSDLRKD